MCHNCLISPYLQHIYNSMKKSCLRWMCVDVRLGIRRHRAPFSRFFNRMRICRHRAPFSCFFSYEAMAPCGMFGGWWQYGANPKHLPCKPMQSRAKFRSCFPLPQPGLACRSLQATNQNTLSIIIIEQVLWKQCLPITLAHDHYETFQWVDFSSNSNRIWSIPWQIKITTIDWNFKSIQKSCKLHLNQNLSKNWWFSISKGFRMNTGSHSLSTDVNVTKQYVGLLLELLQTN